MRLTESIRSAFVHAVLKDTPKVDYTEQRQKLIQDWLYAMAPAPLMRVFKDQSYRRYFSTNHVFYQSPIAGRSSWGLGKFWLVPDVDGNTYQLNDKIILDKLLEVDRADRLQDGQRGELERKLKATIKAFNTVKQARDALPEFVKYLPDDADPKCKTLPAITDLVTDLVKAGWPDKGKKNDKAKVKTA